MHGDFSLNPLAYRDCVSRVLLQQGRVTLESDANEQTESLLRFLRGLAFDVIGAHGGIGNAFELVPGSDAKHPDLLVRWGSYYVDGIRCLNLPDGFDVLAVATGAEIADGLSIKEQRGWFAPDDGDWTKDGSSGDILFYLDVFERHVSSAEDESQREVALLGPDTASRAVVVWRVRAMSADVFTDRLKEVTDAKALPGTWAGIWDLPYLALNLLLRSGVRMRARAVVSEATDPCTIAPDARYRGTENRLYRVEIHDPGDAGTATFKWSADNGSIVYPVRELTGQTVHLESLGRDDRTAIRINDWVEVVDDQVLLMGIANPLLQVVDVRPQELTVTLSAAPKNDAGSDPNLHPILRRWASPPVPLREKGDESEGWFDLVDGVEVEFSRIEVPDAGYRTGDYWLIPTRTATGDVQWPQESGPSGHPLAVAPHGVDHHYAPLGIVNREMTKLLTKYRRHFDAVAKV